MIKLLLNVFLLVTFTHVAAASDSMVSVKSNHTVKVTADRFEAILKKKGFTIFSRVNHSKNAESVNLELAPTELIVFGNPKVGTPLMQCSKTVAVDLPQKALFWLDKKGQTWLSYNHPEYLKERHTIVGCDKVLAKISGVLATLSKAAAEK